MSPPVPKDDERLVLIFEAWEREVRLIQLQDDNYNLPPPFKLTAIKQIMSNRLDKYHELVRSFSDRVVTNADIAKLIHDIKDYAT